MVSVKPENHRINAVELELVRLIPDSYDSQRPSLILLHEGLGSVAMWRDFPSALAEKTACEVIVYSRPGYGQSGPAQLPRTVRYMHEEGLQRLPQLIDQLGVSRPVLMGHSDGGSISLICGGGTDTELGGIIVMAPHIMVEAITVKSIQQAKVAWQNTDLPARLGKYHRNVEAAFKGWNDIWLKPEFLHWNIEEYLPSIEVPVLAIQGEDDEYGSMLQIEGIQKYLPRTQLLKLAHCRHSPHRDQADAVLNAVDQFINTQIIESH
jgi:pimeloyl-ACP methyl ester carboxylesterase